MDNTIAHRTFLALADLYDPDHGNKIVPMKDLIDRWSKSPAVPDDGHIDMSDERFHDALIMMFFMKRHVMSQAQYSATAYAMMDLIEAAEGHVEDWTDVVPDDAESILHIAEHIREYSEKAPDTVDEILERSMLNELHEPNVEEREIDRKASALIEIIDSEKLAFEAVSAYTRRDPAELNRLFFADPMMLVQGLLSVIGREVTLHLGVDETIEEWAEGWFEHHMEMNANSPEELAGIYDEMVRNDPTQSED